MLLIAASLFTVRNSGNKTFVSIRERCLRFDRQDRKPESGPGTGVQASHQRQQHQRACFIALRFARIEKSNLWSYACILKERRKKSVLKRIFVSFKVFKMAFGDWELFRMVIASLREMELSSFTYEEGPRSVRFTVGSEQLLRKGTTDIFFSFNLLLVRFNH